MSDLDDLFEQTKADLASVHDLVALETVRVRLLGKKGILTQHLKGLSALTPNERPARGAQLNQLKSNLQALIAQQKKQLEKKQLEQDMAVHQLDVSLPGRRVDLGSLHPVTQAQAWIESFFEKMGFEKALGPEVEDLDHNFEALNIPEHHPARDMHDTFYFPDGRLLRTHTSTVQIRAMRGQNPTLPIRIIASGRVYRCDSDLTHTPMFHQFECFMIDHGVSFADLKGVLNHFLQYAFEQDLKTRFRPSYFPFTEPSAEVDIQCVGCLGKGCRICKQTGWLEILGCGMVHPSVLKNCTLDPKQLSGFAFGLGLDRFAMLRYGIDDLRTFFESDLNFLKQF